MIWFPFPGVTRSECRRANSSTRRRGTVPTTAFAVIRSRTATLRPRIAMKDAGMLVNVARHCYIVHAERGSARMQSQGAGMKQQWVGDDVWQQLDPHAGALDRGQR